MPLFVQMHPVSNKRELHMTTTNCVISYLLQKEHTNTLDTGYIHAILFPIHENSKYVRI